MSDLKRVSRPRFLLDGRGTPLLVVVGLAIVIAFVKPWGAVGSSTAPIAVVRSSPSPPPTPIPTADPRDAYSRPYDPLIFGDRELNPTWGIWPAGYMVSFGFAMRAESEPSSQPSRGPSPPALGSPDPGLPVWPEAITIPFGNHLLMIGVNTPEGYTIKRIDLVRFLDDGSSENVNLALPASPWPSHFKVIGIDAGYAAQRLPFWTPGRYRLALSIDPGTIERSIEIDVEGLPIPPPTTAPSPAGG